MPPDAGGAGLFSARRARDCQGDIVWRGGRHVDAVFEWHPVATTYEHRMSHGPVGDKKGPDIDFDNGRVTQQNLNTLSNGGVGAKEGFSPKPDQLWSVMGRTAAAVVPLEVIVRSPTDLLDEGLGEPLFRSATSG